MDQTAWPATVTLPPATAGLGLRVVCSVSVPAGLGGALVVGGRDGTCMCRGFQQHLIQDLLAARKVHVSSSAQKHITYTLLCRMVRHLHACCLKEAQHAGPHRWAGGLHDEGGCAGGVAKPFDDV